MSSKKKRESNRPPTDSEIYESMHEEALQSGEVVELGPSTSDQGALFERMRARISHGHMLKSTFDEAVKRRCDIIGYGLREPKVVDPAVFDSDVLRLKKMTSEEVEAFDFQVCNARMETRAEGGGVYVSPHKTSGFGEKVFGFAYDLCSGRWCMTNRFGLHTQCGYHLKMELFDGEKMNFEIVSGFIFQVDFISTPIMTPFGYLNNSPRLMKKGFADIWSWKKFIPIGDVEIEPRKHRWGRLFTPEYAEIAMNEFR